MCIMSAEQRAGWLAGIRKKAKEIFVAKTKLFARLDDDVQYLVYQMSINVGSEVAMVLPLPVIETSETAVEFLDLSKAPTMFDTLNSAFPDHEELMLLSLTPQSRSFGERPTLVVHKVGSFEASYVPSLGDMDRLDKRFRVSDDVWKQLPEYKTYGFAVFKLAKGDHEIHPMGMKWRTSQPGKLFFPTVHVHDGELHQTAKFDHKLYFQTDGAPDLESEVAIERASRVPYIANCANTVERDTPLYRVELDGMLANTDTWVTI
ncbi:MAG: hypothetical protein QM831_04600 [Kofleriaceae bacterium]